MIRASDQLELFGPESSPDYRPTPDKVRAELQAILAELRAFRSWPWKPEQVRIWSTIFPQMTCWLPDDEAASLRAAFDTEAARLDMASD